MLALLLLVPILLVAVLVQHLAELFELLLGNDADNVFGNRNNLTAERKSNDHSGGFFVESFDLSVEIFLRAAVEKMQGPAPAP